MGLRIAVAIGALLWAFAIVPVVSGARDQRVLDRDAECGWHFPKRDNATPGAACTIVDATVTDRLLLRVGSRSDKHTVPHLTVRLPDGSSHDVDVIRELYDATTINGDAIRAQVFRGTIVRLQSGATVGQTSESPVGREAGSAVWLVLAISYSCLFAVARFQSRRRP